MNDLTKAYSAQACVALANEAPDEPVPIDKIHLQSCDRSILVREGAGGKWSSIMSEEQSQRLDKNLCNKRRRTCPELRKLFLPS